MEPHPSYDEFFARITGMARAFVQAWSGTVYRCVERDYAELPAIADGMGAWRHGARFNAKQRFPAVYASLSADVAVAEALARLLSMGFERDELLDDRETVAIEAAFDRVLDLREESVRNALQMDGATLHADWWAEQCAGREAVCQALGRALRDAGIQAILVPSLRYARGVNVVFFPENLDIAAQVLGVRPARQRRE